MLVHLHLKFFLLIVDIMFIKVPNNYFVKYINVYICINSKKNYKNVDVQYILSGPT